MAPRSTGSAVVYFGLVSIPVKLYSATSEEDGLSFNFLHRACGSRPKQTYRCEKCEALLGQDDLVKGYEVEKGRYVTFEKDELKALEEASAPAIELAEFVALGKIDPTHFDKAYHLAPDAGGERGYAVLAAALESAGRVGLGRYAARGKQHFVMVRAAAGRLVLQQLLRAERVRSAAEIPVAGVASAAELGLALRLVQQLSAEAFRPDAYPDVVRERVLERIRAKVAGQEITAAPVDDRPAAPVDLLEALKASVEAGMRRGPKRAERAPAPAGKGGKRAAR